MNSPQPDRTLVVAARTEVGPVVVLELADPDGVPLPAPEPGAHLDLLLPDGVVRQYSLCGSPAVAPGRWRLAVLHEPEGRGGSAAVHAQLVEGERVGIAGPRNHFGFEPGEAPVLLIAGGIGVTPLVPMASAARAAGLDYTLYVAGHADRLPFVEELGAEHGERVVWHRSGVEGRLDVDALLAAAAPGTAVYCCGPAGLLDAVEAAAARHGLALHTERFVPEEQGAVLWDGDFEVEFTLSGVTATVSPDRSILEVAEENGIFVLSSCQEGTCGTCETPVIDGVVDHRDSILTPAERERGDVMYVCVSRAACPRLVVEL